MATVIRVRSPNYPAMSLPAAIERVRALDAKLQHLPASRETVASYLGYNSLNGSSLKILSALLKYGLLEKTKDDKRKISDLAHRVLHPSNAEEEAAAIREAAFKPVVFAQIAEDWPGALPSVESLTGYLRRKNFAIDAIPELIASYRETVELVAAQGGEYKSAERGQGKPGSEGRTVHTLQPEAKPTPLGAGASNLSSQEPYRVSFTPNGMEIVGSITDVESADALIATINALKLLLKRSQTVAVGSQHQPDNNEE